MEGRTMNMVLAPAKPGKKKGIEQEKAKKPSFPSDRNSFAVINK